MVGKGRGTPKRSSRLVIGGAFNSITASFKVRKTFRFVASNAFDGEINVLSIRDLVGIGYHSAVPANGLYRLIDQFRIQRLRLMYVNPASATPGTVSVNWVSGTYSESNLVSATSVGIEPAVVDMPPPRNAAASFWCGTSNFALFQLVVPAQTIVELTLDLVLVDREGEFITVIGTVSDSYFYIKPLDSILNSSAGVLSPQGYKNIITA
jgi:hypothetical protein